MIAKHYSKPAVAADAEAFASNDVDAEVLRTLTADDLSAERKGSARLATRGAA